MSDIKLYNEDCMSIMKSLSDDSVDLIVTDPPYRTTSRGNAGTAGGMCQKELYSKGTVFEHNDIDCKEYAPEFYRLLKWGGIST